MGAELIKVGAEIFGAETQSRIAILQSYDSRFAFQVQGNSTEFGYEKHLAQIYTALWKRNLSVDVIAPTSDLSKYELVIAPALHVLADDVAANLRDYVRAGGTLVVTPRTGVKDVANAVVNQPLPGLLADVCGVIVDEYDAITPELPQAVAFEVGELAGQTFPVETWCDILATQGAAVIARYAHDYYAGKPAVTMNNFGEGQAIYLGAFGDEALLGPVCEWLLSFKGISPIMELPAGMEVTERWQGDRLFLFLLNHNAGITNINLDRRYLNLLDGAELGGAVKLNPLDVLVLTPAPSKGP
jgi:beta-galactosidase